MSTAPNQWKVPRDHYSESRRCTLFTPATGPLTVLEGQVPLGVKGIDAFRGVEALRQKAEAFGIGVMSPEPYSLFPSKRHYSTSLHPWIEDPPHKQDRSRFDIANHEKEGAIDC